MHFESFRSYDDTVLAAHWAGDGDLAIVLANGLGGTFTAWQPMVETFRDRCRFYSWDYRGLYRSERPRDARTLSIEGQVRDLLALMEHFGLKKAVVAGWSMGVQVGLELYRQHPEMVQGMILLNGTYGNLFRTAFKNPLSRFVLPTAVHLARGLSPLASAFVHSFARWEFTVPLAASLRLVDPRIDRGVFHGIAREFAHLDMDTYLQTMLEANRHDAGDVLADVEVPVLVIAGDRDMMTPQAVTDRMMKEIHGAELFVVPRGTHYCLLEYPELIGLRLEKFLRDHFGIDGERRARSARSARRSAGGAAGKTSRRGSAEQPRATSTGPAPTVRPPTEAEEAHGSAGRPQTSTAEEHQRAVIAAEAEVAREETEAQHARGDGFPGRPLAGEAGGGTATKASWKPAAAKKASSAAKKASSAAKKKASAARKKPAAAKKKPAAAKKKASAAKKKPASAKKKPAAAKKASAAAK